MGDNATPRGVGKDKGAVEEKWAVGGLLRENEAADGGLAVFNLILRKLCHYMKLTHHIKRWENNAAGQL